MRPPLAAIALATAAAAQAQPVAFEQVHDAAQAAREQRLVGPLLARPARGADGSLDAAPVPPPPEARALALATLQRVDLRRLLDAGFRVREAFGEPGVTHVVGEGIELGERVADNAPAPGWMLDALRRRVAAANAEPMPPRERNTEGAGWSSPWHGGEAMVWSGPAVRDRVARYQGGDGRTQARVVAQHSPADLFDWATRQGRRPRIELDESRLQALMLDDPLPLVLRVSLPVWLVTPGQPGLLPATLSSVRPGDTCSGGGWIELAWAGTQQPPIWAVLFLPDDAVAGNAQVRRLAAGPVASEHVSQANAIGRLALSWSDNRLPPLQLVAKRFGESWGTYAEVPGPGKDEVQRISASGMPECELR